MRKLNRRQRILSRLTRTKRRVALCSAVRLPDRFFDITMAALLGNEPISRRYAFLAIENWEQPGKFRVMIERIG